MSRQTAEEIEVEDGQIKKILNGLLAGPFKDALEVKHQEQLLNVPIDQAASLARAIDEFTRSSWEYVDTLCALIDDEHKRRLFLRAAAVEIRDSVDLLRKPPDH
jgi:hypothetical protein